MIFSLIKIDGSYGEGGGQILRSAIGLSVFKNKAVEIYNIRKNRSNPGIKPQHYMAIKSIKKICNAETTGLDIGSKKLIFKPGQIKSGKYKFDIKTAGSIPLAFQAIILSCLKTDKEISIHLRGGTDVKWSLSWDFFEYVSVPILKEIGVNIETELIKRGYYPKGGGEAKITIKETDKINPIVVDENQVFSKVNGIINISNLPDHISKRIKDSILKQVLKYDLKASIDIDRCSSLSPGVGVTLWSKNENVIVGSSVLGEKGVSSETVGNKSSDRIIDEIKSGSSFDAYSFDQIIPYLAIATESGSSKFYIRKISGHAETNIWLVKHFFDCEFDLTKKEKNIQVKVFKKF